MIQKEKVTFKLPLFYTYGEQIRYFY